MTVTLSLSWFSYKSISVANSSNSGNSSFIFSRFIVNSLHGTHGTAHDAATSPHLFQSVASSISCRVTVFVWVEFFIIQIVRIHDLQLLIDNVRHDQSIT
eukprot:TRINITY_DN28093_c0_g1_i1.p1 TRINITY_DN28093_c0_g1~~TRINITY_DN28093_c0_g1_i1.p1  ORF type:complete len:100 (-),score=8.90 TRINITY_DN28093_c0_g1_i1:155-454(-)